MNNPTTTTGRLLTWPMTRSQRPFRIHVIEPTIYEPAIHDAIFNGALRALIVGSTVIIDKYSQTTKATNSDRFDLVIFPEAFLAVEDLTVGAGAISTLGPSGCIHVGLRPNRDQSDHLFSVTQFNALIAALEALPNAAAEDLAIIREWLDQRPDDGQYNIGCIFAIDSSNKLRFCLHPKMVRSKFEKSPLHEKHMTEANLAMLLTLIPDDPTFLSITLQPLLCSDALALETDVPWQRPLEVVNRQPACFDKRPPDHIDVVSLSCCTPQVPSDGLTGSRHRQWHQEFRDAFRHIAGGIDMTRHHHAVVAFSNFENVEKDVVGGLSGAFLPTKLPDTKIPAYVQTSSWGKTPGEPDFNWSLPSDEVAEGRNTLAHITQLSPNNAQPGICAKLFSFTVSKLPRDGSRWGQQSSLVDFQLKVAQYDQTNHAIDFSVRSS